MKNFNTYHFDGQKNNEKILLVLHRHWFDIIKQFFPIFLMTLLLFVSYYFQSLFYSFFNDSLIKEFMFFIRNLFFMFIWMTFFIIWIDYYFDIWIITDQHIVNIEQKGLFARTVSELEIEKIQDVTTEVKGLIPTFLNYGNLLVQTAAEKDRFTFHNIPDPYSVRDLTMKLQAKQEALEENEFGDMLRKKIHHDIE